MTDAFEFRVIPTLRDLRSRFVAAENAMLEGRRDELRELARAWVAVAQDEAPKRMGEFAKSIGYRTFVEADALGFRAFMAQPLGNWIRRGTPPHEIRPRVKRALYWPGAAHPVMRVQHPGTRPNPFDSRAYRRWLPGARAALRRIALRYSRTLVSGTKTGAL